MERTRTRELSKRSIRTIEPTLCPHLCSTIGKEKVINERKKFYPILVHIIVCVCWYLLNYLFFIGPEPGILTQYVYNFINQQLAIIMMIVVIITGLGITFCVYFNVGKQMRNISTNDKVISISGVIFFNLLILLAIFICTKNIRSTIYYSQFTFNAPFFVLIAQLKLSEFWSMIFFSTIPSIIISFGAMEHKNR